MADQQDEDVGALLARYEEDLKPHITIDDFNLKQVQLDLPQRRHYWVGRLMFHKQEILKLKRLKKQAQKKITDKIHNDSPVGLSDNTTKGAVFSHPVMLKIDDKIADHELLVDYLTKVEANFRSLSFDIKNVIEIIRLETT